MATEVKMKTQLIKNAVTETRNLITSKKFMNESRTSEKFFTRVRKMSFVGIITFIINFLSKSLQAELDNYFEATENNSRIPQQALSKARQHIKPEAFKKLFQITSNEAIHSDEIRKYKGYRIFAIDGTELHLEPTKELVSHYGERKNGCCKARASILCEVNDGIIIDAQLESLSIDERTLALRHIEYFETVKRKKDLIIFDRGYPSKELISILIDKEIKFLMRLQKGFNSEIDSSSKEDFFITIEFNNKEYRLRVIKLQLSTGETETLITNLARNQFKKNEFKELYFKRWPIETKYNTVKNKLAIEVFSGKTCVSIQQDFYAAMYISNMVGFSKMASDEEIRLQNKEKELKYEYQTNESMLISKLKNRLILALLVDDTNKRKEIVDKIIQDASLNRSPIKPDRHCKRSSECYRSRRRSIKRARKNNL